jgi:hypothetical protein
VVVIVPYQRLGTVVEWGSIYAVQGENDVFIRPPN